jgi:hypothetical protein
MLCLFFSYYSGGGGVVFNKTIELQNGIALVQ